MPYNLKQVPLNHQRFAQGGRTCSGCGIPGVVRTVLSATRDPVVVSNATGCLEVTSTIYPYTTWKVPWIHNAFENAAATISGVERAFVALKKQGKIDKEIKFIAFGGDGGTYDIGLQSLSGALERGHNFVYVCYDNEGYMNTGNQRSSATPYGADTTTTPAGKVTHGKEEWRKDLVRIAAAHNIPYAAQAAAHNLADLYMKAEKAFAVDGPAFITVLTPCPTLWKHPTSETIQFSKIAVETRFWPLFEIEKGKYKINYKPSKDLPVSEFLKNQGRFKHLFAPENKKMIDKIQEQVDRNWKELLLLEEMSQKM